ncbi:MAG TPA: adenylate/guanylate cyclase domain-containing protein [Actinomycetota bacterium]|nr:adenylate/guanylate cyclase domain-containing protein [Actinomycetota bacterium]
MKCPTCGSVNPDGARFCNACGARLDPTEDAGTTLDPFLPKELLAKLEAARAGRAMEGERRVVTMLFCDVKGSTAMAETLDPEDWAEIMNGAFERLIAPVYRYEGTLARLMGDAIFAFFGAPIAHEDDPQRAVWAGLDIVSGIATYRRRLEAERGLALDVRVGINTGPVMVGQVGSDLRLEYTAMGDAVNVAARMEQTADPGTVQITEETRRLVEPLFDVEARGRIEVKGKAEPVAAYVVLARRAEAAPTRRMRGSPLVGRDREMEQLREAIEDAQSGRGRIVSLIGEAGLGKSRLIEETRAEWTRRRPEDPTQEVSELHRLWESWHCVSYDATRPYSQYRRALARIAGIEDTDPPDAVRRKLAGTIESGAEDWIEPHMRVWRSLFGVPEPGEEPLEGEAFRDAIMDLVPGSTRRFHSDEPSLLVFDDLHWCDEASMDVLIETTKLIDDMACLLLFAYRPDREASSWRLKQWLETEYPHRSIEVRLAPLTDVESGHLIDALLPEGDPTVRARILERTDGNPLFVEEVAAVLEHDEIAIPSTLQALFTARLDALDEGSRHALQLASVIGRSFSEPVLGAVSGEGDLSSSLRTLERLGLIAETARRPEREYTFHHSLTQEATYGTILLRRRRELHQRVGEVLEERYASRVDEFAPVLAHHFREAGDDERTLRYATIAANAASRLYAHAESVTHATSAIEAAKRLGRPEEVLGDLYPNRGRALELSGRFEEAVANYEEMEALAQASGARASALAAAMALTTLYATPTPVFDAVTGQELFERTIVLARELDDRAAEAKALWNLMILNTYSGGDPAEAIEAGERSLAISRELDAREQIALTLNDLWRPYAANGDLRAARDCLDEARPLWREMGNLPMLCENLSGTSAMLGLAGENDAALALCDEAYAIAAEIGNPWGQSYSLLNAYHIDVDRGDLGRAMDRMRECIELAEAAGFVIPQAVTRAELGALHANLGDLERGMALADEGLQIALERSEMAVPIVMGSKAEIQLLAGVLDEAEATIERSGIERLPGPIHFAAAAHVELLRGRLASARGEHDRAAEIADMVLEWLRRLGVRPFLPAALLLRGRAMRELGRTDDAQTALQEARSEAERMGFRPVLWRIDAELGGIAAARRDAASAADLRSQAHGAIEQIAQSIDDAELRSSFLALPDVEALTSD